MASGKLILISGDVKCSPKTVLHQALERLSEMEGVVVLMLLNDDRKSVEPLYSDMKLYDLVFAERVFSLHVDAAMRMADEENEDGPNEPAC